MCTPSSQRRWRPSLSRLCLSCRARCCSGSSNPVISSALTKRSSSKCRPVLSSLPFADVSVSIAVVTAWLLFVFQVKYKEGGLKEASDSLYHLLPETLDTQHAREASQLQSEVHRLSSHLGVYSSIITCVIIYHVCVCVCRSCINRKVRRREAATCTPCYLRQRRPNVPKL